MTESPPNCRINTFKGVTVANVNENKKLVERFWNAFSKNEFDTAISMMSDDFTWWIAGDPKKFPLAGLKTKPEFVKLLNETLKLVPGGIQVKPYAVTAEGDRIAVEAESHAKTTTGKTYNNQYHFLMIVKGGKVHSIKEYLCTMHANEILCT